MSIMSIVNPDMEAVRMAEEAKARKDRAAQHEAADSVIGQCEECALPWLELAVSVRQRVCRAVQLAHGGRCFDGLADRLGVDPVDRRFYSEQASGQLKSSTELMLEDLERRAGPLSAALVLRFLRERNLLRVLADVSCGVQEACALRQQQLLRGHAGGSPMDSGYQGAENSGADIVGVLSEPPDSSLVKDAPTLLREALSLSYSEKKPSQCKKIMLTYAMDGRDTALYLAKQLKALCFKVLLPEEQRRHRLRDTYSAIQKWFTGVDYIVPVLTAQYFAATQNRSDARGDSARRLAEDVRCVYTLMCAEMETNGHVNYRVRAVIADGVEKSLRSHPLYGSPLFRFPFGINELESLADCMED